MDHPGFHVVQVLVCEVETGDRIDHPRLSLAFQLIPLFLLFLAGLFEGLESLLLIPFPIQQEPVTR